jgi:hypothetical protein
MKAFEACFLEEPVAHWICDEESLPVVKNEFCSKQRDAVVLCMQNQPVPAPPPASK